MISPRRRKLIGGTLVLAAVAFVLVAWAWARTDAGASTDNAYVRGEVTSLAPKVGGYVVAVDVQDNQAVPAGAVLFRIDDRDYRARLAQADANVLAAQARLASIAAEAKLQLSMIRQAEAQRRTLAAESDLAVKNSDRRRELIQSGAVSQSLVDESEAARARTEAGFAAASAALEAQKQRLPVLETQREAALAALAQAAAAKELAKIDLENTIVRAPIAGIVGNRQARVGRLVAAGAPILDIVPADDVWVVANFKETQVAGILPGQPARIAIDGFPDHSLEGIVDSFAPGSGSAFSLLPPDNATGNFVRVVQRIPVKIRLVDNPFPGRIVPGMSARVSIDFAEVP